MLILHSRFVIKYPAQLICISGCFPQTISVPGAKFEPAFPKTLLQMELH